MNVITAKNLTVPRPSGEWMQKLRASMLAFAGPGHPLADCLAEETWPGRHAMHCVYSVGLRTIIDLKGLDNVDKPLGWRFIAGGHRSMGTAAACWSPHESSRLTAKVACAFEAPELAELLADTEQLNQLPALKNYPSHHYDLRVLRIPALHLEAFWLKSQSAERGDLIVPYGLTLEDTDSIKLSAGRPLKKNQAYPVARFLDYIRDAARLQLATGDNAPPAPAVRAAERAAKQARRISRYLAVHPA